MATSSEVTTCAPENDDKTAQSVNKNNEFKMKRKENW